MVWLPDLHAGSNVGPLANPWPLTFEEAENVSYHSPSKQQKELARNLSKFIGYAKKQASGKKLAVILGGDLRDGPIHHDSLQTFGDATSQEALAIELLSPLTSSADELDAVRGSDPHAGDMAEADVRIARELGVKEVPFILRKDYGGVYIEARHHTSTSRREWMRGDSLRRLLKHTYYSNLRSGTRVPDLLLRGHVHLFDHEILPIYGGMQGAVSGGWKLGDSYTATKDNDLFSIGGVLFHTDTRRVECVDFTPKAVVRKAKDD